jgi:hypothetical protein
MNQGIRIRTVILLWLLLTGVSGIQAQPAGDIDTLSQWRVETSGVGGSGAIFDQFKYYITGLEVIDSLVYYKVYKSGYWNELWGQRHYYEHVYSGSLREQGNVWYTYEEGRDTVLFDFNLEVGDTVISSVNLLNEVIVVDSIAIIQINGEDKKQIYFTGEFTGEIGYIIEDVGSATGLLQQGMINWFEHFAFLHCYAIDFVPLWINPVGFGCDLTVSIEENISQPIVSAYPNPFTTSTTIEYDLSEPSLVQLTIYNAIGKEMYRAEDRLMAVGKHSFTWSSDRLPEGLYYAVLRSEEGISVVKLIKQ